MITIGELKLSIVAYRGLGMVPVYRVDAPFEFCDHRGKTWSVPAGFETDGASFPWWLRFVPMLLMLLLIHACNDVSVAFWWAMAAQAFVGYPVHRVYSEAAVAHDFLYATGVPRCYADAMFLRLVITRAEILHDVFILRWKCHPLACAAAHAVRVYRLARAGVMWLFVASFGWAAYAGHRRRKKATGAA